MLTTNYLHYLKSLCLVVILGCFLTNDSFAQDASNKRGFQPGNSFSVGDFETINTTNGNLMLKFPLAGLPAGRNGITAGINLFYNSKVLDSDVQYFLKSNSCVHSSPDCPYYKKLMLKESDQGGWQFGMNYSLKVIDRREEFVNVPQEQQPTCSTQDPRYFEMRYHIKLILLMPDGSTHEMRPNGWSDGNFNDPLGDYFEISPDGFWDNCSSQQWYTNTITYYSIDGSFLRLDIQHDTNTAGGWQDNPWTLYFPDGSKVTTNQPNNEPQRFYDRNNNYVELDGNVIRDQFNRSISISSGTQNGASVHTITSQGFGETLTWTVRWKLISVLKNYWPCTDRFACDPEIQQQEPFSWTRSVVDTITLPAQVGGLTYTFSYNAPNYVPGQPLSSSNGWGEINGITLPSGAQIDYQYVQDGSHPDSATRDILRNAPFSKVLTYNQEYDGTSTPITETWTYGISQYGSDVTSPDGGTTTTEFFDTSAASLSAGLTYRSVGPDGTKTETIWARNDLANGIASNQYPKTVFTSIKNLTGTYVKTAIKDYKYDKNGNVTRLAEYDWVNYQDVPRNPQGFPTGVPSVSPTRVTVNTYHNSTPDATQFVGNNTNVYWSSGSPRVKNAIESTEVRRILAGTEEPVTRSEYTYDNASVPANLTQSRTWDSTKAAYSSPLSTANSLTATTQYNQYGMPTLVTDPRGLKMLTTYGQIGTVTDLYPTQIKSAYQTSEERTETREYDFGTGLTTRVTDTNNNVATVTSFDALGRPTLVRAADGKSEETRTAIEYSEVARRVVTRSDLSIAGDGKIVSIQHYDQLGRVRLTRQLEDAAQSATDETTGIKVQTRYQYSGANSFMVVSNPYRATTSGAAGSETTMGWTRSKSDNVGRTTEVQTFGGTSLPAPWGSSTISTGTVTTNYDANFTTVTDPAQKTRRSVTDGLGRLIRVDEPDPSGDLGPTAPANRPTDYSYNVLGNLTHVTQSDGTTTQNRDFTYSSLSLLTASTQPESGTRSYKYDASGNLIVKTDARGVSIHYVYDALNRVTRRWYNGSNSESSTTHNSPALPSGVGSTDEVKFYYDAQSLPTGAPSYTREYTAGRLVAQTYGTGSNGDYYSYDALGRTKLKYQQTGAVNYRINTSYNLVGGVTSLTYPSDHAITNSFDTGGRLLSLSGNIGSGGGSRTYASGILYTPSGALTKEQFGTSTAVYNKRFYNSRGQLAEIRIGTSYTGPTDYTSDRGAIVNAYSSQCLGICLGSSMTDNNGNLKKQEIHIPNSQMRWQQFEYDSLNRLSSAREVLDGGPEQWKQQFDYDRWGNRTINSGVTYGGINEKGFTVNTANNRLGVPAGQSGAMDYDLAGNLTNDTYSGSGNRTYDAENKITSAWGGNNQAQLYSYDGSGRRIKRTVDSVTTWQVYGLSGELLAEYAANGPTMSPQKEYGYRNGELLVTAEPGTSSSSPQSVAWSNVTGASTSGSTLTKMGAAGWNAGAVSVQTIASGDGYVEFTASETNLARMCGLGNGDSGQNYTDIEFAIQLTASDGTNGVWIFESGTLRGNFGTYSAGDKFRVAVEGGSVKYYKISGASQTLLYTSTVAPTYPLLVDTSLYSSSSTVTSAVISNGPAVSFTNATGVSISGNTLTKTGTAGWNAGAVSTQTITSGDGYVEFTANETNLARMCGLGNSDSGQSYTDIEFAIQLTASDGTNGIWVFESGTLRGKFGTYSAGDKFRVAIEGGVVKYRKNGTVFYTSSVTPTYPLLVDTSLYSTSSTVSSVVFSGANGPTSQVQWLVSDQLGTPRMILDQTGSNVKRHDYLPFGEELFAPNHGRTTAQGYEAGDGIRQQFTSKERDGETGLDYFGARYYGSVQGRFTGPDPYDINFERQNTPDPEEANALFKDYLCQPQDWNRYTYVLNNPLKYVDPDGLYEYEAEFLGKKIKVHIDDSILKKDVNALQRIQENLQKAFDKINGGADKLTPDQIQSIGNLSRISVSNIHLIGMVGGTFQISQRIAENPNIDKLSADIIHDSRHAEQEKRGLSYSETTVIPMEMEASQFTVGVIRNMGGWDARVLKDFEEDARTGHRRQNWKDKSTPKSRARVFEIMSRPQKRRN